MYRALTDLTILVHLAFIAFVIFGGLLARLRRWVVPVHLLALVWAVYIELSSQVVCPLTAAENYFADHAGIPAYSDGFVAHYLVPINVQEGLPSYWPFAIVLLVVAVNILVYARFLRPKIKAA